MVVAIPTCYAWSTMFRLRYSHDCFYSFEKIHLFFVCCRKKTRKLPFFFFCKWTIQLVEQHGHIVVGAISLAVMKSELTSWALSFLNATKRDSEKETSLQVVSKFHIIKSVDSEKGFKPNELVQRQSYCHFFTVFALEAIIRICICLYLAYFFSFFFNKFLFLFSSNLQTLNSKF